MKPIIIEGSLDFLFATLLGIENTQTEQSQDQKPIVEFGCNQAIIVRN